MFCLQQFVTLGSATLGARVKKHNKLQSFTLAYNKYRNYGVEGLWRKERPQKIYIGLSVHYILEYFYKSN